MATVRKSSAKRRGRDNVVTSSKKPIRFKGLKTVGGDLDRTIRSLRCARVALSGYIPRPWDNKTSFYAAKQDLAEMVAMAERVRSEVSKYGQKGKHS